MNRFFYYLLFVNMVANMVASVPRLLLEERMNGALLSMALSTLAGLLCIYIFVKFFSYFPEKGLPELLEEYLPRFFYYPILILCALVWFTGGVVTLITYSFMLKRFLTPDMSLPWIGIYFLFFITYGILMKTTSTLYTVETVLAFSLPLILFFFSKAYSSEYFMWDFVRESFTYIQRLPNYNTFSASLYLFLGVANMIIFNRTKMISGIKIGWKQLFFIGITAVTVLMTTYIIPIGMNGFNHINELVYPAVFTSDTLRMKFGIVERLLYLFLVFFLAITFLSMLIHWHVAIEICKNIIWFPRLQWKNYNLTPYLFVAIFWVISLKLLTSLTEYQLLQYTRYFFNSLPIIFSFMFFIFWLIKRRAQA